MKTIKDFIKRTLKNLCAFMADCGKGAGYAIRR